MLKRIKLYINKATASILLLLVLLLLPLCCGRPVFAHPAFAWMMDSLLQSGTDDSLYREIFDLPIDSITSQEDSLLEADSIFYQEAIFDEDSLFVDSINSKPVGGGLTAVVNYKASDSLVFAAGNMAWLFGSSEITYNDIDLTAERIQLSLDSSLVHANGVPDSTTGKLKGKPVFKDNSGEYETRTMSYNFKTAIGYIQDVTTQQGDGYVTGGITKKMPDNDIFLEAGRYTTCDQTECPHFYIELTKARVRPNKNIVTGPAYLVVSDVPLPVAIPFGFFPFTKSYSSGLLMPTYGVDNQRGLYLRDGGYYFAFNDYIDMTLRGEVYTLGSWGLNATTNYAMRYKFKGNLKFSYVANKYGDKGLSNYHENTSMKIAWSHSQDSRFNPNLSLSASVNFTTPGFERNDTRTLYSPEMTTASKNSSVNATYRIPNSNWTLSATANIDQNVKDSTVRVSFPQLSASMTTWYPFKRKQKSGSDRWYEKISMNYNMVMSNSLKSKQSTFLEKNILRDWENGIKHSIPIQATFTMAKYIQISPSISFTDRMYSHKTVQYYDPALQNSNGTYGGISKDTLYGFYNAYDFNSSVSASTTLYGFYKPIWKNSKLFAVRHVLKPSLSFTYTPDFSNTIYNSWGSYMIPDSTQACGFKEVKYSYFEGYSQGTTSRGRNGSIGITLNNNIEAKIRTDKDSTGYKKISIIDNLSTNLSYNMIADSMRWSQTLPVSATFKYGKNNSMNLSAQFDNYLYDENGRHYDALRIMHGKLPRLINTSYSWSYSLNNEKLAKLFGRGGGDDDDDDDELNIDDESGYVDEDLDPMGYEAMERDRMKREKKKDKKKNTGKYDDDGYLIWTIPWSVNLSYTMSYGQVMSKDNFDVRRREYHRKITHNASLSGTFQPTKGWNFSWSTSYNFDLKKITFLNINFNRDMHCWAMTCSLNPMGQYASFNVNVAVKAQMLQDLKYEKSSVSRSNQIDWYEY